MEEYCNIEPHVPKCGPCVGWVTSLAFPTVSICEYERSGRTYFQVACVVKYKDLSEGKRCVFSCGTLEVNLGEYVVFLGTHGCVLVLSPAFKVVPRPRTGPTAYHTMHVHSPVQLRYNHSTSSSQVDPQAYSHFARKRKSSCASMIYIGDTDTTLNV